MNFKSVLRSCLFLLLAGWLFYFSVASRAQVSVLVVNLPAASSGLDIQQALDHLPFGGEVRLATGTYTIRQPILLQREHQTLRGSGPGTILLLADHANCPVVVIGSPINASQRPVAGVHLSDLMIDGNRAHQDKELWRLALDNSQLNNDGVMIWETVDATVEHIVCCRCRSGGLVCSSGTRRLTVRDLNAFDNQYDGLACYGTEDSHFSELQLHDNQSAGISLDLSFNQNVIEHASLVNNDLGIFMRQSRSNAFRCVTIEGSRNHGIFMAQTAVQGVTGWQLSPGTQCSSNNFVNLTIRNSGGNAFWVKDPACTNNVITNATFVANAKGDFALPDERLVRLLE